MSIYRFSIKIFLKLYHQLKLVALQVQTLLALPLPNLRMFQAPQVLQESL